MKIRISESKWKALFSNLWEKSEVETAAILMGECIGADQETVIAIHQVVSIPNEAYTVRKGDQISIDPIFFNRLIRPAIENNWSVITIHTHPNAVDPWFSVADDLGDNKLMPSIHCRIPGTMHGSMVVVNSGNVVARIFDENGNIFSATFCVIGNSIWKSTLPKPEEDSWFSRQSLALGESGQSQLKTLTVGVVGLGGTGSLVSMQLAHLGVGRLILIDGDIVEESNVSRIVGASTRDVDQNYKVDVAKRYAKTLGLNTGVTAYQEYFSNSMDRIFSLCDIVFSCVDKHSPRALINRYSYLYHVPVIDMGSVFRTDEEGLITSDAGRVVNIGPGKPCLSCWGHIDPDALRFESMGEREIQEQIDDGYIQGIDVSQPSVVGFNTYIAGSAVTEMLRMVTSFSGAENPPKRLAFSFSTGEVRRNKLSKNQRCTICGAS